MFALGITWLLDGLEVNSGRLDGVDGDFLLCLGGGEFGVFDRGGNLPAVDTCTGDCGVLCVWHRVRRDYRPDVIWATHTNPAAWEFADWVFDPRRVNVRGGAVASSLGCGGGVLGVGNGGAAVVTG